VIPLRDDTPCERTPVVTWVLLALNVAAFGWQLLVGLERSVQLGGAVPFELLTLTDVGYRDLVPPPFTAFTSMFLHGGFMHIGFNMLFLWIFGNNVEDALGRARFLAFYLASGLAAVAAQTLATAVQASGAPSDVASALLSIPMVGASGAIAGVLAAYMVLFPRARVETLFIIIFIIRVIPLPAGFFIGAWFALQVLAVVFGGSPGVAVFAHIGGFLAGWLLIKLLPRRAGFRLPRAFAPSRRAW
jgi:membrane associated rhomboid family serine protease